MLLFQKNKSIQLRIIRTFVWNFKTYLQKAAKIGPGLRLFVSRAFALETETTTKIQNQGKRKEGTKMLKMYNASISKEFSFILF